MADNDKYGAGASPGAAAGPGSAGNDTGQKMADDAKQYAEEMAGRAKEQGRTMFEQQKHSAANQVDSMAHAFRGAAGQLQGEDQSQASRYVAIAADRLESFGRQLREKDMDSLIEDAETLGRRAPGAFFAGSVVAGFLFARFLKSSSERRHGQATRSTAVQRSRATAYESDAVRFPEDTYDMTGSSTGTTGIASGDGTGGNIGAGPTPSSSNGSAPGGNTYGNR